jgi:hypothetical protein
MTSVAPCPPKRGWLVNARSWQWIINDVRPSTLPPPVLNPPDKLDSFLDAVRWDGDSTADVNNIRSCFRFGIERGGDLPRPFAFEESPSELWTVRMVPKKATQEEKFVIATNMPLPESSVIRSLFEGRTNGMPSAVNTWVVGRTRKASDLRTGP